MDTAFPERDRFHGNKPKFHRILLVLSKPVKAAGEVTWLSTELPVPDSFSIAAGYRTAFGGYRTVLRGEAASWWAQLR